MPVNITSPVTGSAQTNLTTPTYTLASDTAPGPNGKQYAVTLLGGTQTGVRAHSVSEPFTVTVTRPLTLKVLPAGVSTTSIIKSIPSNEYKVITRKGVTPLVGQPVKVMPIITNISVPAGADLNDKIAIQAALSLHIGALQQISASFGDLTANGVL